MFHLIINIMKLRTPETALMVPDGLWVGRRKVQSVFVRRHNLDENLRAVQDETANSRISVSPDKWILLLEGRSKYSARENLYLDALAKSLQIVSEDPVVPPFTSEIAKIVDIEKTLAALSVLVMEYLDFIDQNECVAEESLREFLDAMLQCVSRSFDISPKQLQNCFIRLKWDTLDFWQDVELFKNKRRILIDESNHESRKKLIQVLSINNQPNVFILSGISHKPAFAP